MTQIATVVFAFGILGLFWLERDSRSQTSKALWIPVVWMSIAGSRNLSLWLQPQASSDLNPEGSTLDRIVIVALVTLGMAVLVKRGPKVSTLLRSNGPILLFFFYCALSILWSDYPGEVFKRWIKSVGDLLMVLIVITDPDPCDAVRRVLSRVSFFLLPLSILVIKYYPELSVYYGTWDGRKYFAGVATDKNMLGMSCLVFGLVSTWRIIGTLRSAERTRRTKSLIVHGVLLAMALWLFSMIDSKTSLFCFLFATGLMAATHLRAMIRKPWVIHLLVASVLLFASSVLFFDFGSIVLESIGRDTTLTGRTDIWNTLVETNQNPLLGVGFESFWMGPRAEIIWKMLGLHVNEAHNGYLEVFLNLGWMGIALLAFLIATGYRNVVGAFRRDPEAGGLWLAYFVVGIVYSFTEAGFRTFVPVWITFLLAIIASAADLAAIDDTTKRAPLARTGEKTFSSIKG